MLGAAIMWMVLTWLFGVPAILWLGITGTGLATCLVNLSNYFVIRIARRHIRFSILPAILPIWGIAALVASGVWLADWYFPADNFPLLLTYATLGGVCYLGLFYVTQKETVRAFAMVVRESIRGV